MPTYSNYGLPQWVDADVTVTALENTTAQSLLDAAAGHVGHINPAQANEEVWFTTNAVLAAGAWTYKAAAAATAIQFKASDGSMNEYAVSAGAAGAAITWGTAIRTRTLAGAQTIAGVITPTTTTIDLGTIAASFRNLFLGSYSVSSTNGSSLMPNGFVYKWGQVSVVTSGGSGNSVITFNTAFPSNCINMQTTLGSGPGAANTAITQFNASTAACYVTAGANATWNVYWTALGY